MAEREPNIHERLMALADGELDPAQAPAVQAYLAEHPEAAATVIAHQQLRARSHDVLRSSTPPVPAALLADIAGLAVRAGAGEATPSRFGRFVRPAAAAAVLLLVGGVVGALLPSFADRWRADTAPVPASMVHRITDTHVLCSRRLPKHTGNFPSQLASLTATVCSDLRRQQPYPDLNDMGYQFVGAAPCTDGGKGAHLLYRSTDPDVTDSLSIFMQPCDGTLPLEQGRLYLVSGADAVHPAVAWRTQQVIYCVVGNEAQPVRQAAESITSLALAAPSR